MAEQTNRTQLVMVKVMIGSGYIQFVAKKDTGISIVTAARTLGFKAAYEFNFAGCQMASAAQKALVFAKLREAAREQGYASLTFHHTR
jgi:hypothetical protein